MAPSARCMLMAVFLWKYISKQKTWITIRRIVKNLRSTTNHNCSCRHWFDKEWNGESESSEIDGKREKEWDSKRARHFLGYILRAIIKSLHFIHPSEFSQRFTAHFSQQYVLILHLCDLQFYDFITLKHWTLDHNTLTTSQTHTHTWSYCEESVQNWAY